MVGHSGKERLQINGVVRNLTQQSHQTFETSLLRLCCGNDSVGPSDSLHRGSRDHSLGVATEVLGPL
jgi:hypothetical protein